MERAAEDLWSKAVDAGQTINLYVISVLLAIGILANVLLFVVICSIRKLRKRAICLYILAVAAVDIALSLRYIVINIMDRLFFCHQACWIIMFVSSNLSLWKSWILVASCVERLMVLRFPQNLHLLFTLKKTIVGLVLLPGMITMFASFFHSTLYVRFNKTTHIFFIIATLFIPSLILMIMCTLVLKLNTFSTIRSHHPSENDILLQDIQGNLQGDDSVPNIRQGTLAQTDTTSEIQRATNAVLAVVIIYLIFSTPYNVSYLITILVPNTNVVIQQYANLIWKLSLVPNAFIYCAMYPCLWEQCRALFFCKCK